MLATPQERVAALRPFWEGLDQEERVKLLTLSLDDVRARAELIVERQKKQAGAVTPTWPVHFVRVLEPLGTPALLCCSGGTGPVLNSVMGFQVKQH